jgi:hypothetical protein
MRKVLRGINLIIDSKNLITMAHFDGLYDGHGQLAGGKLVAKALA